MAGVLHVALYGLYVALLTLVDWLQRRLGYAAPYPVDIALRWLPAMALICLAIEALIQLGIRIGFDTADEVNARRREAAERP
jgi:hypothetical protein